MNLDIFQCGQTGDKKAILHFAHGGLLQFTSSGNGSKKTLCGRRLSATQANQLDFVH